MEWASRQWAVVRQLAGRFSEVNPYSPGDRPEMTRGTHRTTGSAHLARLPPLSHQTSSLVGRRATPDALGLTSFDGELKALDSHRARLTDRHRFGSTVRVFLREPTPSLGMTGAERSVGPVALGNGVSGA
jgi:hypothetical protein